MRRNQRRQRPGKDGRTVLKPLLGVCICRYVLMHMQYLVEDGRTVLEPLLGILKVCVRVQVLEEATAR